MAKAMGGSRNRLNRSEDCASLEKMLTAARRQERSAHLAVSIEMREARSCVPDEISKGESTLRSLIGEGQWVGPVTRSTYVIRKPCAILSASCGRDRIAANLTQSDSVRDSEAVPSFGGSRSDRSHHRSRNSSGDQRGRRARDGRAGARQYRQPRARHGARRRADQPVRRVAGDRRFHRRDARADRPSTTC